ncbi:MAG: hypothetical protein EOO52_15085 [Gammaproteobacteria bacterium]|nr:MAG: hypothetical protein EOO52_15085 [Gammaproteobacteria bacterium]
MTISAKENILFNEQTLECINFALMRANKVSSRAGIAWVLQDKNRKIIHSDATIAGVNSENLAASVRYHGSNLDQLILTVEPIPYLFDIENLVEVLTASNCSSLIVCYKMPANVSNYHWNNWLAGWDGEIIRLPLSIMGANLAAGPRKIITGARPWVTTISSADMHNNNKNINDFSEEFGVTAYIKELVNQSRAVLYSPDQKAILASMDEANYVDEAIEYFEVSTASSCEAVFRHCIVEKRCSVLVFADMELLAHLMQRNLTDEIVHHLAVTFADTGSRANIVEGEDIVVVEQDNKALQKIVSSGLQVRSAAHSLPMTELPLSNWTLQSSTAVGKCSRLLLKSNIEIDVENDLRQRLN